MSKTKGVKLSNKMLGKPNTKGILKGIASIIKDAKTLGWANLPSTIIDTIDALKFDDTTGMVGWKLINRSLVNALTTLVYEIRSNYEIDYNLVDPLDIELDKFLDNKEYYIDSNFFKDPKNIQLLNDVKPTLSSFLKLFSLNDNEANNILDRLDSYFVYSLINEWRTHFDYYAKLEKGIITPFDKVGEKEQQWVTYWAYLENQIHKPVFSESFSLEQLYIPLRGYYKEKENKNKPSRTESEKEEKRIVIDLEKYLLSWIKAGSPKNAIKILRGGPGYGKSSFLKMLAAKLASINKRVLFIPLHLFDLDDKLVSSINNYLIQVNILKNNPFDDDEQLVILFDGLDELSMQGKALLDIVKGFLREVEKSINTYNTSKLKVQAIISGRDVIIQQNETEFREDEQILSLLPYYVTDEEKKIYIDKSSLLKTDQRNNWWAKYGALKGKPYNGLPKELANEEIDEITAQPLLNFLIAMSYERGQIDFTQQTNLNTIYNDLLEAVYERGYSEGKKLKTICELKPDSFYMLLEEIALSAWHGTGRTTTVNDIKKHFESNNLTQLLNDFIKDAENGVVALLAAFYFRQAGQNVDGSQTFEFTHKSFGEYLTSRKIIRQLKNIHRFLSENENDIQRLAGWNTSKCLEVWVNLFVDKELDFDIIKFIKNELTILNKEETGLLKGFQQTLIKLINTMLIHGIPIEKKSPRLATYKEENEYAINAERSLFTLLGLISSITDKVSEITWPTTTSFGEVLCRMNSQRMGPHVLVYQYFNHLDLKNVILHVKDLYGINLGKSIFINSELAFSVARLSNLVEADFTGSSLLEANLSSAILRRANFTLSDLTRANLQSADLNGANLKDADLKDTDLEGADLEGANLEGANLKGANLKGAILTKTNLKNTILDKRKKRD